MLYVILGQCCLVMMVGCFSSFEQVQQTPADFVMWELPQVPIKDRIRCY